MFFRKKAEKGESMKSNNAVVEAQDGLEAGLAAQEWGVKNGYRLFGFNYGLVGKTPETAIPFIDGVYVDGNYKRMVIIRFDLKVKQGKVSITRLKGKNGKKTGLSYPIRFARTNFDNHRIVPVRPLYDVLVLRGLILPFRSVMKQKEWAALPFEDGEGIKPTEV